MVPKNREVLRLGCRTCRQPCHRCSASFRSQHLGEKDVIHDRVGKHMCMARNGAARVVRAPLLSTYFQLVVVLSAQRPTLAVRLELLPPNPVQQAFLLLLLLALARSLQLHRGAVSICVGVSMGVDSHIDILIYEVMASVAVIGLAAALPLLFLLVVLLLVVVVMQDQRLKSATNGNVVAIDLAAIEIDLAAVDLAAIDLAAIDLAAIDLGVREHTHRVVDLHTHRRKGIIDLVKVTRCLSDTARGLHVTAPLALLANGTFPPPASS